MWFWQLIQQICRIWHIWQVTLGKTQMQGTEETFGLVGFESIFVHLEIISNGRPTEVLNDRIDISKSNSYNEPKIPPE